MRFGQYELLERVAVGGMAEVFRGRAVGAEGFEKWIAIKRVLPDLARDEAIVAMLLSEARIHATLSHRNIVQIHDLGVSEDGEYFIVLEYVEGHDMRAVIEALGARSERVPDSLALFIASEVAQGLHFAHEAKGSDGEPLGLVHRDVSPSNVLVSFAGEVKLSDFGIAKRRQDASAVGTLKGNLVYMSPEQARRAPLDRRTDLFALGAVLFEMLTGYKLRDIRDEVSGWREVAAGKVRSARALRPDLPQPFEDLLMKALAADPADRFPDVGAFGAAIRDLRDQGFSLAGPNDLATFIKELNPARRPRSAIEMSKVIRLLPEQTERALAHASSRGLLGTIRQIDNATAAAAPLSLAGRPPHPTPLASTAHRPTPMGVPTSPASAASSGPTTAAPAGWAPTAAPVAATAWTGAPAASGAMPAQLNAGSQRALPLVAGGSQRSLPVVAPVPDAAEVPAPAARSGGRAAWRWGLAAAVLAAAVVAIHLFVAPLDLLAVWFTPATLAVSTEPPGARVRLDGHVVDGLTPLRLAVRRDRQEHVLELSLPGFHEARRLVRYDRSEVLSTEVTLAREPAPTPSAPPPPRSRPRPPATPAPASPAAPPRSKPHYHRK